MTQGKRQTKGVRQLVRQGEALLAPLQRLVRIAQHPQDQGREDPASHARVLPIEESMGAVLLRVVQGHALLQVGTGRDQLAQPEQGISQGAVPLQEERRIVVPLRQGEEVFGQLTGGLQVPPYIIKPPEAKQHRADLTGVSQPPAQGPCPAVGVFDLRGGKAPGGQERRPQGALQREFVLGTLGRVREEREHLQRLVEVANRFPMGRAPSGALARLLPVAQGMRRRPASV